MHAFVQAIFVIGIIRREPDSKDGYVYPPGPQAKELPYPFLLKNFVFTLAIYQDIFQILEILPWKSHDDQNSISLITVISPSLFCSSHIAGPGLDDWAVPSFCGAGLQRLQAGVSISFSFTHPCLQAGEGRVQGRTWTCAQHLHLPNGWMGAEVFNILNKVIICMLRMIYDWQKLQSLLSGVMSSMWFLGKCVGPNY